MGWSIDYQKLLHYLKNKYNANKTFYFGGVEMHDFRYNYLINNSVPLAKLEKYLTTLIKYNDIKLSDGEIVLINRHLKRVKFYHNLENFGYHLFLKPVKIYVLEDGGTKKKANCDVEMTLQILMRVNEFRRAVVLSGDGDFLPVLKYLKELGKEVLVLARGPRTAREIRQFAGSNFRDFEYLKFLLKMDETKRRGLI